MGYSVGVVVLWTNLSKSGLHIRGGNPILVGIGTLFGFGVYLTIPIALATVLVSVAMVGIKHFAGRLR